MDDNKNNKNTQNGMDQTNVNNSGVDVNVNNTQQQNQNNQQNTNVQQQNNQNTGGTGAKTFTQDDVNRMMAAEKNQGRNAAYREMGIDLNDPNSANMLNMFKAFMSSMQTPEQVQQQIKIAEAESRVKKAETKAEAMQLGILPQFIDDALAIIMSKLDDKTDVKTVVGELKTKYPVWFNIDGNQNNNLNTSDNSTQNQQQNNINGQTGTGSSVGNVGNKGGQNNGTSGIGARLAASRKTNGKKSSFWD